MVFLFEAVSISFDVTLLDNRVIRTCVHRFRRDHHVSCFQVHVDQRGYLDSRTARTAAEGEIRVFCAEEACHSHSKYSRHGHAVHPRMSVEIDHRGALELFDFSDSTLGWGRTVLYSFAC